MLEIGSGQPEELTPDEVAALWADDGPILGATPGVRWVELDGSADGVAITDIPEPPLTVVDVMEVDGQCVVVASTPSGLLIGFDAARRG
ncbi:hypothetical protein I0C86_41380 [Plantactinospora sp. S1510]|uniref:Uncharacterized protein n=1 Tax=Plantactinospora alkalitolerans TaxID=2789879 RepID=A0ABS0H9Z9_9ACTN|nr:hypothetical protein [Plantactinospora alkalitolerans]MBF9135305.1 hypothetical protein [Plantactinospora alkalitolerans]